jgi:dCMP deaminase
MNDRMKNFYMSLAKTCAGMSRAVRLRVGCVIVKDNNIISFSWNGTPAGWDNKCEDIELMPVDAGSSLNPEELLECWPYGGKFWVNGEERDTRYRLVTKPEVLHAERNALDKLAKLGNVGGQGASLFCTHAPCLECAKSIFGAGITEVFYENQYRSDEGVYFLKKCGINITQFDNIEN